MACSRKDFVAVAKIIAQEHANSGANQARRAVCEQIAWNLSHYFGSENQQFDKIRFLNACGVSCGVERGKA